MNYATQFVFVDSMFVLLSFASAETPKYSAHVCTDKKFYQPKSKFESNLNDLLSSLISNATLPDGYYHTSVARGAADEIKGLFLCRGDVNASVCQDCVSDAAVEIRRRCTNETEAIIWYDVCLLRYSNDSYLNNIVPSVSLQDEKMVSASELDQFRDLVATTLNDLTAQAMNSASGKKFATKEAVFRGSQKLYTLGQCIPEFAPSDCNKCFRSAIAGIPSCCDGRQGARVLLPSCNIRYETYQFYNSSTSSTEPFLPPTSSGKSNTAIVVAIVVPIGVVLALFIVGCCYLRKRARKKHTHDSFARNSIREELNDVESLQFDLATIEAATNGFSDENKIGQGGFGVVYKGVLPNGEEIAVKRLSVTSLQGAIEFRSEVTLVAKLQHRNLTRLLGYCLEGREKMLVYEYIPNKSLDHFLFDPVKQRELNWSRRYKIIIGIARGILYLHEDSQLRIIHRDLKASNVLLDENMNPKISDFGMAKLFEGGQTQANTGRIVGTYGYMSPEYAMRGQFSVKSDVFSFGVLVLEIISGKKNTEFYQTQLADDLLSYAWKNWTKNTPLELLDPTLRGSYSRNEVIRCIHIGLLCVQENPTDRPSMATVTLMLNSYSVTLSLPRQPASFQHKRTPNRLKDGLDSDQSTTCSIPWSTNEVSMTEIYPR